MPKKKQGRAGRGRAAEGFVRPRFRQFERALQRASSAMYRDLPASTWWSPPLERSVHAMLGEARALLSTSPAARELYYAGHRLHIRAFDGWVLVLDSRRRPLVGPVRLKVGASGPKRAVAKS